MYFSTFLRKYNCLQAEYSQENHVDDRADCPFSKEANRFINTLSRRETFNFGPEIPHGWFWPYSKGPTAWAADGSRYENRRTIVISGPFISPWRSRGEDRYRASVRRRFVVSRLRAKFSRNAALKGFDPLCKTRRVPVVGLFFKARPISRGMESLFVGRKLNSFAAKHICLSD